MTNKKKSMNSERLSPSNLKTMNCLSKDSPSTSSNLREKDQTKLFAIVNFAKEILDVSDNLERALETSKDLADTNNSLYEGVKLTKNCLDSIYKRN